MRYVYPIMVEQDEDGRYLATASDVPEAVTDGDSLDETLSEMSEALGAALAGYALEGREMPSPSKPKAGEHAVPVAPLVAAKLALRGAMLSRGVNNSELARRLGVSEGAVRRLVDPDHDSRLDRVVAALRALGHTLIIEDQAA